MLIYILIISQHLQNIIFSFEIGSIGGNISLSDYHHLMRKSPSKISYFPLPVNAISKALFDHVTYLHYTVSVATKLGNLVTYLVGLHSDSHAIFNYTTLLDHLAN